MILTMADDYDYDVSTWGAIRERIVPFCLFMMRGGTNQLILLLLERKRYGNTEVL